MAAIVQDPDDEDDHHEQDHLQQQQHKLLLPGGVATSSVVGGPPAHIVLPTSREWSSESAMANHREIQATTMSLDAHGRNVVLGARKMMAVIPLTSDNEKLGEFWGLLFCK